MKVKFDQTICTMTLTKNDPLRKYHSCDCCGKHLKDVELVWMKQRNFNWNNRHKNVQLSFQGLNAIFCSRFCLDISKLRGIQ
jgi:hypothetical protein